VAELEFDSGFDAWVIQNNQDANRTGGTLVRLQAAERKGVVQIPVTGLRGKTVTSAFLIGHVGSGWVAQTLTAHALAAGVKPSHVTWENFPSNVPGVSGAVTTGVLAAGATVSIPVGTIVQAWADGTPAHGFVLTTDAAAANTANLRSITSGKPAWTLLIVVSDAPEKPTNLRPNDGSVGSGKPALAWSPTDLGGSNPQAAFQVQIDAGMDGVTPDWTGDSSDVPDPTQPLYDLTLSDYPGLALHATTAWRVRTQDAAGAWSDWSDWATWTYTADPGLVMDSPTGGVIGDPTFSVLAHITGGESLTKYRVRVARGTDRTDIVYDSGDQPPDAGTIALDIPWRDPSTGRRVIVGDDTGWQVNVRAWGDVDRAEAVGHPSYVQQWTTVTFDDDSNEPPADYTVVPVAPGDPRMVHTWTRSEAADKWVIHRGSHIVHQLTEDDVDVDAGTYTFTDRGETPTYRAAHYTIRAVDAGTRSVASNEVVVTSTPEGVWLIPEEGEPWVFDGNEVQSFTKGDRSTTFQPINSDTDTVIYTGYPGVFGAYSGILDARNNDDVLDAVDRLEDLRRTPTARPQLVWASQSVRVQVKNPVALPSNDITPDNLEHVASFGFVED
jgi:hypothetical protein